MEKEKRSKEELLNILAENYEDMSKRVPVFIEAGKYLCPFCDCEYEHRTSFVHEKDCPFIRIGEIIENIENIEEE